MVPVKNGNPNVNLWDTIGTCSKVAGSGRGQICDDNGDGEFIDTCRVGTQCNPSLTTDIFNGGCGTLGVCTNQQRVLRTVEYLNDAWTYNASNMIWKRFWAQSTRPTHRAFFSMVILEDMIAIYGGISPFCYHFCKDVWMLNLTTMEWKSDVYQHEGVGYGGGDEVKDGVITGGAMPRPITWSYKYVDYGNKKDPAVKLQLENMGYRQEEMVYECTETGSNTKSTCDSNYDDVYAEACSKGLKCDPSRLHLFNGGCGTDGKCEVKYMTLEHMRIPDRRSEHSAAAWRQPAYKQPYFTTGWLQQQLYVTHCGPNNTIPVNYTDVVVKYHVPLRRQAVELKELKNYIWQTIWPSNDCLNRAAVSAGYLLGQCSCSCGASGQVCSICTSYVRFDIIGGGKYAMKDYATYELCVSAQPGNAWQKPTHEYTNLPINSVTFTSASCHKVGGMSFKFSENQASNPAVAMTCGRHSCRLVGGTYSDGSSYTNLTMNLTVPVCNQTVRRYRHVPSRRWMVIYGGYGGARKTGEIGVQKKTYNLEDTWKYDLDTRYWHKMDPYYHDGKKPGLRRGQSAIVHDGVMYMFGGRLEYYPVQFALKFDAPYYELVSSDVWAYNITNNSWKLIPNNGEQTPEPRHGHRAAVIEDIMYVFGGYYDPIVFMSDTWHYNITASVWLKKFIDGAEPTRRYQFGMALDRHVAVIFGGYGSICNFVNTGTPGLYCEPTGSAFYLADTWHYNLDTCTNNCVGLGRCHFGSCICQDSADGLDCSNFTCPDCASMSSAPEGSLAAKPCEIWAFNSETDDYDLPASLFKNPNPLNPVTESHFPKYGAGVNVKLLTPNTTKYQGPDKPCRSHCSMLFGNCYYDFAFQKKRCISCSNRGTCDASTGSCICDPSYSNFDCSYKACPDPLCGSTPATAEDLGTSAGMCMLTGRCICNYGYFEKDCSINFHCDNECSLQGVCEYAGICRCYDGFKGDDCSVEIAMSHVGHTAPCWWIVVLTIVVHFYALLLHG